jgi:hypothetical protein
MMHYIQAPALCQGADEDLLVEMGAVIFPDFIERNPGENGLRLRLKGNSIDESLLNTGANMFQLLLGILRAWNRLAGERADEVRPGIGKGSIKDEQGNQTVFLGSIISYTIFGSEIEMYSKAVKLALDHSKNLYNALWLNGRRDRNAADFYMIYEYAVADFGDEKAIVNALGVTHSNLKKLRSSANNLTPTAGGRHAIGTSKADWSLEKQKEFVSDFLKRWIKYRAHNP